MEFYLEAFKAAGFLLFGEDPSATTEDGVLRQRIHTFFLTNRAYVTLPGVHYTQRTAFVNHLNSERLRNGESELTSSECKTIENDAVSIVVPIDSETNEPFIGIRIDGEKERAAKAAEMLTPFFPPGTVRLID